MNLNYSSFMHLLKEHYLSSTTAEELARGLLEVTTNDPNNVNFVDSTYLSRIWNGDREIAKNIRDCIEMKSRKKAIINYFQEIIIVDLIDSLKEDYYSKLALLIANDNTISDAQKNKFYILSVSDDHALYLANVYMYALSKPNKGYITKFNFEDGILFEEVDQRCPLCNKSLIKKLANQTKFFFSPTNIFPIGMSKAKEREFDSLHSKIDDLNCIQNKICLCNTCAADYLFNPTIEVYDKLYCFKNRILKHKGIMKATSTILDAQIKFILENIKGYSKEYNSDKKLRMTPLNVANKIYPENKLLQKAIKDDNDAYYNYIKETLSQLDDFKISFKRIAHEVADCYLQLSQISCDQDEIYNGLIDWILNSQMLPESYRNAAHIVISFFVQNCEVFDEISK